MQLFNDTPFVAQSFEQAGMDGLLNAVVVARGSFVLELGGAGQLRQVDEPRDKNWHDVFETTSRGTSLVNPGDMAPFKPATDVTLVGAASSMEPRNSWPIMLQVGSRRKTLRVHGERYWEPMWKGISGRRIFAGWRMTEGQPSTLIPLTWEKAVGGARPSMREQHSLHPENPVGVGLLDEALSPKDSLIPAPQIEAEEDPIEDWRADYKPAGFAPIAPWWGARHKHVGTYDDGWRVTRSPLLPLDFKYDFWQAAPAEQNFRPWLFGNERIHLSGVAPSNIDIRLPLQKIFCAVKYKGNSFSSNILFLDGLHMEMLERHLRLRLSWRASFPLTKSVVSTTIATLDEEGLASS